MLAPSAHALAVKESPVVVSENSWSSVTSKVVSDLTSALQKYKDSDFSSEQVQNDFADSVLKVMTDNSFGAPVDSLLDALSEGNSWFSEKDLVFIEHSTVETVCLSGLELLPNFSIAARSQDCVSRASLIELEAVKSANFYVSGIVRNAKAIAAMNGSSSSKNQAAFMAQAVSEASGAYNKPSKKFLKGKGVFKSGDFTVYVKKGTYKINMIQNISDTDKFMCTATVKNKLSKISKVTCKAV